VNIEGIKAKRRGLPPELLSERDEVLERLCATEREVVTAKLALDAKMEEGLLQSGTAEEVGARLAQFQDEKVMSDRLRNLLCELVEEQHVIVSATVLSLPDLLKTWRERNDGEGLGQRLASARNPKE